MRKLRDKCFCFVWLKVDVLSLFCSLVDISSEFSVPIEAHSSSNHFRSLNRVYRDWIFVSYDGFYRRFCMFGTLEGEE